MMAGTAQYKLIHPIKYYRDYLSNKIRPDGRAIDKFRPVIINVNSINTADGSAIVKIGNTTVVCGIKAELSMPKAAEPDKGFLVPNIELTPLCSSKYRPGAPTEEAQVYSQCLADIVINSECIDLKDLCIVRDKLVWVLYCDVTCLDHDGSILDASCLAIISALRTLKLPAVEYNLETNVYQVNEDIKTSLNLKTIPVSTTFIVFDETLISDPTSEEEQLSSSIMTIAVSNSQICFIYKPGGCSLAQPQMDLCLKQAIKREKLVCNLLESVLDKNTTIFS